MNKFNKVFKNLITQAGSYMGEPLGCGNDFQFSKNDIKEFKKHFEDSQWEFKVEGYTTSDDYNKEILEKCKIVFDTMDGGTKYSMKIKFQGQVYNYSGDVQITKDVVKIGPFNLHTYNLMENEYDYDFDHVTTLYFVVSDSDIRDKDGKYICLLSGTIKIKIPANVVKGF